jgi:hypothetical protein
VAGLFDPLKDGVRQVAIPIIGFDRVDEYIRVDGDLSMAAKERTEGG